MEKRYLNDEGLVHFWDKVKSHTKDSSAKLQSQIDDKQTQISANDKDIEVLQTRSTQIEQSIKDITASGGASIASAVSYDNANSGLTAVNSQAAMDELAAELNDLSLKQNALMYIQRYSNLFFDDSKFTEVGERMPNGGMYTLGQGIDEEPFFKSDADILIKATFILKEHRRPLLVLLEDALSAAFQYRSYAIFDKDNNIIKEEAVSGNVYLLIPYTCTIIASCTAIKSADYGYLQKKYVNTEIARLDKEIAAIKDITDGNNSLTGKTIWTLWDSLGENTWQSKFVQISGTTFYGNLNVATGKPITAGGTTSSPDIVTGGQQRAINLVSYKDTYPIDMLFIENINDTYLAKTNKGTIDDEPFMRSQLLTYKRDTPCTSYSEAKNLFNNSFQEILSSFQSSERKTGTILSIPFISTGSSYYGSRIKFTKTASKEGDIGIILNGIKRSIHVNTGTSLAEIVKMFIIYNYGPGWTARDNGDNSISICYYTTTGAQATFDDGGTGVTVEISDATYTGAYCKYFISKDVNLWMEKDKWVDSLSLYSIYKGLLGYLQYNLPNTKIYWVLPEYFSINFSDNTFKNEDGTLSINKYKNSDSYTDKILLYGIQKDVCELFNIPVIDLRLESGLNLFNSEMYFNANNPHPKQIGYDKYAEAIYKLLPK